ncbi:MAG: hypothetical protein D3925_16745, partial [Candidatus Electrothrix sp. AR5]|nr:hypothetical protein [Candidatus Electrothrix sp. AR5]
EEREFLVWQEKLRVLLGQWEESGKDEGALLRGLPLNEALRWRESHGIHLVDGERNFIAASETLRERARRAKEKQRQKNITSLVVGLVIAVLLSLFSAVQWRNAEQERQHAVKQKRITDQQTAKAEQQSLAANYNLAKAFEEKALAVWKKAEKNRTNETYWKIVLFTSAALEQKVEPDKSVLKPDILNRVFAPEVFNCALAEQCSYHAASSFVTKVAFSPDGTRLASASWDNTVRLWDIASGKEMNVFTGHTDYVNSVAFSPDGTRLASASADNTVRLWDIENDKETTVFKGHTEYVFSVVFSPDGTRLASASWDNTVRLWDIESGKELTVFKGHTDHVTSVAFSPDGTQLASASGDIRLWDIASGKELNFFRGYTDSVFSVAFSPDGTQLASASWNNTVRLLDIEGGKELTAFKGHTDHVTSVAFSPDGTRLASASWDNTIRIWKRKISLYTLFLHNSKPTPLYHTFIEAVKFLWQLDVQGLEIVKTKRRTPADLKKYGTLLAPTPPN